MKFDTFHPAVEKGLPVTRVISRFILQKLLAEACVKLAGEDVIMNNCVVCDYEQKVCSPYSILCETISMQLGLWSWYTSAFALKCHNSFSLHIQ